MKSGLFGGANRSKPVALETGPVETTARTEE
jgi:hypothetical protein